ncbi:MULTISPECIES: transporter substrate-binding domain-containing protein [Bacillales]|uniref:Glutamine ABC transporter substrate binding protein n=1 Tax=Brevibacillus brevis (strain 47 / JCM 6285 / NBRC 100599) TaxID=358681 RepID=C0Z7F1_BREBN|nr:MULTISPECIES: transporter substrate-binding domain-containing protein [Bacillales]KMZ42363.1 amino acid ABC transporter substrate-binding protein [Bacillus sp. FJAT-27238]MBH0333743.1 amino acid ABC transporter substrate-binding protein [Brevibacillus brevis]NQF16039.1 transporter substrate-binding domain-containing protein [Brevibacillus sp. HB1.3]NRR02521.1 transporter substrate-binding domain-containing protein [Brevibacillus sp. RS1.1]OUQ89135.1 amino acid ABC transporter substrate-bind
MKANKLWKKVAGMGLVLMLSATALAGCGGGSTTEGGAKGTPAAAGTGTLAKIKERDKFVVGVKYDLNLFGLKDPATGNVEGFDIDIAKAIAKKVLGDENKIELKEVTSKTRIPMLKNGEIDAIIATMTITEDRKKEVDFSDVYFLAGQSFLVKKDSPINGLKDMQKGMKIVTAKGSTSAKNIRASAPDVEVLEFENYAEAFTALKAGQGDALTTDNALLYGMAKQDPNYRVTEETFTEEPYGIAISKGDAEFVKTVNDLLKEMKENGEYDKIYEKWIGTKPKK